MGAACCRRLIGVIEVTGFDILFYKESFSALILSFRALTCSLFVYSTPPLPAAGNTVLTPPSIRARLLLLLVGESNP